MALGGRAAGPIKDVGGFEPDQPPALNQNARRTSPEYALDGAPSRVLPRKNCVENIQLLNDNYREPRQVAQDAFEDALLRSVATRPGSAPPCAA